MISDRAGFIFEYLRNRDAAFITTVMGGRKHYMAANRAARRFLNSNRIRSIAKKHGLSLEDGVIG